MDQNKIKSNTRRLFLWIPVLFGIGIGSYFSGFNEPNIFIAPIIFMISLMVIIRQKNPKFQIYILALLILSSGFTWAQYFTQKADTPLLRYNIKNTTLTGIIDQIETRRNGSTIIIIPEHITHLDKQDLPKKLRLYGRKSYTHSLKAGCFITIKTDLTPLDTPLWPSGYDIRFTAHFKGEGGRGFIKEIDTIICPKERSLKHQIVNFRIKLADYIYRHMEKNTGGIAVALITGLRGLILTKDKYVLRSSGLAHMLAISGTHMGLFAGMIYTILRFLCALIPHLVQRVDVRPYCAFIALMSGFIYLIISGSSVTTLRAFIMIGLIFLAIIFGRSSFTMRNVALAAIMILIIAPYSLMQAGFQMSFAAVIALIAFYETFKRNQILPWPEYRMNPLEKYLRYMVLYIIGLTLTSLIAGMATGFVGVFHFNMIANYGLLANLLAIPILALIIMPSALISLFLMPFNLAPISLKMMEFGIQKVIDIAHMVTDLPHSVTYISSSPSYSIILFFLGLLWLCLWQKRFRLLGIIPLLLATALLGQGIKPDILVHGYGWHIAARQKEGHLMIISQGKAKYIPKKWLQYDGNTRHLSESHHICSDNMPCYFPSKLGRILHVKKFDEIDKFCPEVDIILYTGDPLEHHQEVTCSKTIYYRDNWHYNRVKVLNPNRSEFVDIAHQQKNRPWLK